MNAIDKTVQLKQKEKSTKTGQWSNNSSIFEYEKIARTFSNDVGKKQRMKVLKINASVEEPGVLEIVNIW